MKKIPSLFKRDYEGTRLVYDEVVEGSEWVINGEGIPTHKYDGTACMVRDGKLYKRYDRKRDRKTGEYKVAPPGWEPCEDAPDENTGHWPGWLPVGDGPEDKWHREAWEEETKYTLALDGEASLPDGTYELLGEKVQGNPYNLVGHILQPHGSTTWVGDAIPPRDFAGLKMWFEHHPEEEGIVWHHPDGHMVKIKRRDFGLEWPV